MSATQSMVAVGGVGLIGVNFWVGPQRQALDGLVWNGQPSTGAKTALFQLGGEAVLLLIMYLVAGQSDDIGLAMLTVLITLWILFYMSRETSSTTKG